MCRSGIPQVSFASQTSVSFAARQKRQRQATVCGPVEFSGLSLFHGYDSRVRLLPAEANTGIVFRRTDLKNVPDIPATHNFLKTVPRRTVLASSKEASVETVEHLMAALAGLRIDNCLVEINAPEVPAYDGSCRDFCDGILEVGIQSLDAVTSLMEFDGEIAVRGDHGQSIAMGPAEGPFTTVHYELNYGPNSPLPAQSLTAEITPDWFYQNIAAARTFVLEDEIKVLKQMGYGLHLTTKDLVVVGASGVIDNELRWPDEAVRHKILDCVGDLALSGVAYCGHVSASRSGHHLNHELASELSKRQRGASETLRRVA